MPILLRDWQGLFRKISSIGLPLPAAGLTSMAALSRWAIPKRFQRIFNVVEIRTIMPDNTSVKGTEFLRGIKALGKRRGVSVRVDAKRGKGSHQTLYYGKRVTIIRNPKDELKTGTFHAMLKQLGIEEKDLYEKEV